MAAKSKSVETVEKFQKLAQLALSEDDGEPTEEARNAAVKAIGMLADEESELLVLPRAELEAMKRKVDGASASLAQVKDAQQKGMIMGGLMGFLLGGGKLGR